MFRKPQTTVSLRVDLRPYLLEYGNLLNRTPSAVLNDLFEGVVRTVEAEGPNRASITVDLLRQAKGKDLDVKLSEKYYGAVLGVGEPSAVTEAAKNLAADNTGRVVGPLKDAKAAGNPYEGDTGARARVFGLLKNELTEEIGRLYDSALMTEAAAEVFDPQEIDARNYFQRMAKTAALHNEVYRLYLRDHLARAVVREIPKRFLPD